MSKGKTITTYLVDGNPNGIRTCFISNKICKAVVVPRAKLIEAKGRSELQQPALYILLSDSEDKIYIGETEDFLSRIKHHESNKSFWEEAIIFVSKDNDLTKSDVKYLEYLAIGQAHLTARYSIEENRVSPKPTNLPEHQLACIEEFFEDVCTLASFLDIPVFKKVKRQNRVELHRDLTFKSPSAASSFCIGSASNGWVDWANEKGQSLDAVYRNKEATIWEGIS